MTVGRQSRLVAHGFLGIFILWGLGADALGAQVLRLAGWGQYEAVTDRDDWSAAGSQLTIATTLGHAAWLSIESLGRFGARDATFRLGGTLHPTPNWWVTAQAGTASRPQFSPKNSWELDATVRAGPLVALGFGYRRLNYVVGPVDIAIPHLTLRTSVVAWDVRAFISRNPSERTDAALQLRVTAEYAATALWLLGAAGRESYLVGAGASSQVQSLETVTGAAGVRFAIGDRLTMIRLEASVTGSKPFLSRRGFAAAIERRF